jgi:hypothetical protein
MALLRVLFRAGLTLAVIALMTLVVYPLTAATIVIHMMRGHLGSEFLMNLLRNIFLNHPDVVRMHRETKMGGVDTTPPEI